MLTLEEEVAEKWRFVRSLDDVDLMGLVQHLLEKFPASNLLPLVWSGHRVPGKDYT